MHQRAICRPWVASYPVNKWHKSPSLACAAYAPARKLGRSYLCKQALSFGVAFVLLRVLNIVVNVCFRPKRTFSRSLYKQSLYFWKRPIPVVHPKARNRDLTSILQVCLANRGVASPLVLVPWYKCGLWLFLIGFILPAE